MRRVFGRVEALFNLAYLAAALVLGLVLLLGGPDHPARRLAGVMALVLALGDSFHLIPRVRVIFSGREEALLRALGRGKQITSITMTAFYLLLWQVGLLALAPTGIAPFSAALWALAALRIALCLLPQNRWQERYPPVSWGIWRNIPFFIQGALVAWLFWAHRGAAPGLELMGPAIVLSFAFYLPVVLWSNQNPKIGMLMLPKTCAYLWMLALCLSL